MPTVRDLRKLEDRQPRISLGEFRFPATDVVGCMDLSHTWLRDRDGLAQVHPREVDVDKTMRITKVVEMPSASVTNSTSKHKTRSIGIYIFAIVLFALAGCTSRPGLPSGLYPFYDKYLAQKEHRAFAMVKSVDGSYSASYVAGRSSPDLAREAALHNCKENSRSNEGVRPERCFIYAVDDEILGLAADKPPVLPSGGIEGH